MYDRFAKLLESHNVKVADVARETGLSKTLFSDWKKGKSSPKIDKLKLIADYFGVSLDYLAYGETPKGYYENDETAKIAQDIFENRELKALFDLASDSTPEDIETAYSVLLALKEKDK